MAWDRLTVLPEKMSDGFQPAPKSLSRLYCITTDAGKMTLWKRDGRSRVPSCSLPLQGYSVRLVKASLPPNSSLNKIVPPRREIYVYYNPSRLPQSHLVYHSPAIPTAIPSNSIRFSHLLSPPPSSIPMSTRTPLNRASQPLKVPRQRLHHVFLNSCHLVTPQVVEDTVTEHQGGDYAQDDHTGDGSGGNDAGAHGGHCRCRGVPRTTRIIWLAGCARRRGRGERPRLGSLVGRRGCLTGGRRTRASLRIFNPSVCDALVHLLTPFSLSLTFEHQGTIVLDIRIFSDETFSYSPNQWAQNQHALSTFQKAKKTPQQLFHSLQARRGILH